MMANSTNKILWQEIMELSGAMLYQGERSHWDVVTKLECSRKKLLEKFFHEYEFCENNTDLFFDVSQLLESNQKLLNMVKQERYHSQKNMNKLKKGKSALQAYRHMS